MRLRSPRVEVRITAAAAMLAGGALLLSACTPEPGPTPSGGASPSPSSSGPGAESPDPTATLPEQPDLGEAAPECTDVLSADDVYAYNPNYSAVAAPTPAAGSALAEAADLGGRLCRWSNDTNSAPVDIAVTIPGSENLDRVEEDASSSTPAPGLGGDAAFFDVVDGAGVAQVFAGDHWIVVSSPFFGEATDAGEIVAPILANLDL
ncbi:hypothetical protein ELQ90_14215 [Labedella phragmitis]|uniref:Iron ABC transporter ATP-binding protein n=1 Tax=Labedella phragmitis TaxID=2498849 RepID=A0A3S5CC20_9MICO|nr:hypothetical protein [Labedella phragmitis]RWZ46593.1 hypothetical protein ELQ90_14215 [Labedella phragmitis]